MLLMQCTKWGHVTSSVLLATSTVIYTGIYDCGRSMLKAHTSHPVAPMACACVECMDLECGICSYRIALVNNFGGPRRKHKLIDFGLYN